MIRIVYFVYFAQGANAIGSPGYPSGRQGTMNPSLKATKKEIVTAFRTGEILAAARKLLYQRGLEAMTMGEIAAAAGVAKGTLYLYFQSKDDLIQALITQVGENIIHDVEAALEAPGSPPEKLIRTVAVLLEYLNRERLLFPIYARELLRGERESREGFRRRHQDLEEKFVTLVTSLFAEGIAAGQFIAANPRLLTFLLRGLVRATGYYQKSEGQADAAKEALPVILTMLSSGLIRTMPSTAEEAAL
jgi:AcrR family transcriptional regulator